MDFEFIKNVTIKIYYQGILQPHERLILERAETEGDLTPRPLIVIDCENLFHLLTIDMQIFFGGLTLAFSFAGMLLLLKECSTFNRYSNKSSSHKNVEMLMAFKKSCGNMIKFATKNMPHAVIQVIHNWKNQIFETDLTIATSLITEF